MRLRRLRLTDFRGVRDAEVSFAESGVTVVLAENEAGKSSLLEAFGMLFRMRDDSQHRAVRAVRPVGRDVGSTVEARLELGGHDVVYRKTWSRDRGTVLTVDGRPSVGRDAHDAAAALFGEYVDDHLWTALVVGQSESLLQPVARDVGSLLTVLSDAADAEPVETGPAEESLTLRVEKEYRRYFTASFGRPTGELAAAEEELEAAEKHALDCRAAADQIDRTVDEAHRLDAESGRLRSGLAAVAAQLAALTGRLTDVERAEAAKAQAAARVELAQLRCAAATEAARARTVDVTRLSDLAAAIDRHRAGLAAAEAAVAVTAAAVADVRGTAEASASLARRRREEVARWHRAEDRRRDENELRELDTRLEVALTAAAEQKRHEDEAGAILATPQVLDLIDRLVRETALAQARLDAATPRVTVHRIGAGEVTICGSGEGGTPVGSEPVDLSVTEAVVVTVTDAAEIRIVPPAAGVDELRAALATDRAHIAEALADLGAVDVDQVRDAVRRRDLALRAASDAGARVRTSLGRDTMAVLRASRDRLAEAVAGTADELPDGDHRPDPTSGTLQAVEARAVEADHAVDAADAAVARCEATAESARREELSTRIRYDDCMATHADLTVGLAQARDLLDDEAVAAAADVARAEVAAADTDWKRAVAAFAAGGFDEIVRSHRQALESEARLRNALAEVEEDRIRAETRLEDAGASGLATAVEEAEADLEHARENCQVVRRRADAAALLKKTLEHHMASARVRYAAPLKRQIEEFGRIAFGPSFEVRLDDDLDVIERSLDGVLLPVAALSTGAQEQLAIVVRLAIASLTGKDGAGVPLILDDVLGWSDPERLVHMQRLLGEVGRSQQIIVLTSQWDRYRLVPGVGEPVRLSARSAGGPLVEPRDDSLDVGIRDGQVEHRVARRDLGDETGGRGRRRKRDPLPRALDPHHAPALDLDGTLFDF